MILQQIKKGESMKKFLMVLFLLVAVKVNAQCVAEIKDVIQDEARLS